MRASLNPMRWLPRLITRSTPWRQLAGLAALTFTIVFASWLEASMARHMLLQLPLLVLAGWLCAPEWSGRRVAVIDEYGITGLTALLFVSAYWMVPRALEQSLVSAPAQAAKYASLLVLGMLLPGSLKRCPWVIQLFFLGNFGAMMAIAGMQYQAMPQRLCNAYLLDDQNLAGQGLVAMALLISAAWCKSIAPALSTTTNPAHTNDIPHPAATEPGLDRYPGAQVL